MQARGERIRRQREESGYGLRKFAELIGISPSWLSRIEREIDANPSPDVLKRIATALRGERDTRDAITEIAQTQEEEVDGHAAPPP